MKLSVLQENFVRGLNTANRFVATRAQLPILNNILLTTDKGRLKISATNLETGINLWLGAKIEKEGTISIPARILAEFVASLPADRIDLEVKENKLFIVCGSFKADFIGLPASEFPVIPSVEEKTNVSFKKEIFTAAVNQVAFAAATDEGRPVLTGVLLSAKGDQLILVATDGYRLSLKKVSISKEKEVEGLEKVEEFKDGLIVPARTLSEVARILGESEEEKLKLAITPESNQIIFALSEAEVVSRLIEGKFPDFEKIIPEKGNTQATLETEDLLRAVRIAAIFARESANIVRFNLQKDSLEISANTAQLGTNLSQVEIKLEGPGGKIAFNSRYLLDFLNTASSQQITFEMGGALNPGVFRPISDSSFFHIIMPVRVQE